MMISAGGYEGGPSMGNSYRIHGDGSSWPHLRCESKAIFHLLVELDHLFRVVSPPLGGFYRAF